MPVAEIPLDEIAGRVLLEAANEAVRNAHAPYSRFAVGAALLLEDGAILTAANMENASYGLSLCAETVVVAMASSAGRLHEIVAVAIVGGQIVDDALVGNDAVRPCGRCRQILMEAADLGRRDLPIYCMSADGRVVERHLLSALLPHAFGPADLQRNSGS